MATHIYIHMIANAIAIKILEQEAYEPQHSPEKHSSAINKLEQYHD